MRSFPVPQLEAHRGHAGRPRLQPDLRLPAGRARDAARRRRQRRLDHRQPAARRAPLRGRARRRRGHHAPPAGDGRHRERLRARRSSAPATAGVRTLDAGVKALGELRNQQPFLLAVDAFDPQDAYEAPRVYVRRRPSTGSAGTTSSGRLVPTRFSNDVADDLSEQYARGVEAMDKGVGRLLDRARRARPRRRHARRPDRRPRRRARRARLRRQGRADLAPALARGRVHDPPPEREAEGRPELVVRLDPGRAEHAADPPRRDGAGQDGRRGPHAAVPRTSTTRTSTSGRPSRPSPAP